MIASRLKLIRQARGLTLDELSELMGRAVTKQALSKYETQQDAPSARVLILIAKALGVTTEHLLTEPLCVVQTIAYRTKKSLAVKEKDRLESMLRYHLEEATWLRELVQPNASIDVPVQDLPVAEVSDAEDQAADLRDRWKLGKDPIGSVVDVLEDHGVTVCLAEADGEFDGLSAVARRPDGLACGSAVLSRKGLTHSRQRLNLAHELGHVVLKPGSEADDKAQEEFAWRFAGAFLAPRETLLSDVGSMRRSIGIEELLLLKKRYGMSMQALLMRFRDLGVLTPEAVKQAFITLNRLGIRRNEPGDEEPTETPQWFRRTTLRAVSEGLVSSSHASELLGVQVQAPSGRNQLTRLLAAMPVAERDVVLAAIPLEPGDELDREWLDAPIGAGEQD